MTLRGDPARAIVHRLSYSSGRSLPLVVKMTELQNAFSRRSRKHPLTLIVEVADTAAPFRTASLALKPRSSKP